MRVDHEVVVLGGGPAGCAAAAFLAKRGHDVVLLRPGAPPAGALAQSLPPSANKLLIELGFLEALEAARFHRNGGNTIWWAGADARTETFASGQAGFHVDRTGLEAVMAPVARAAGAVVHDRAARSAEESDAGWVIRCEADGGDALELRARWVLDATGRRGLIARREGRRPDRDTTTLALVRRWKRAGGFPQVEATHTLVESYRDGWAWSVPLDREVRCFTAMVDQRGGGLAGPALDAALDGELDKAPHVGAVRGGAVPLGPTWACPASLYTADRFGRRGMLLVGDAGSFIDPLSSFGVKKALSSGWMAGVAVHTALTDSAMEETAVRFFDERERAVYRKYRAQSADFFEACAREYEHDYWASRAKAARVSGDVTAAAGDPDALDDDVPADRARAALERIRTRPSLDAVRGASVRTVERPTVVGHRIALAHHLASDRTPRGLRYVRNVDLMRVLEIAPRHPDVPAGWEAYNAGAPAVTLPDYLAALATAFAAGFLDHGIGGAGRTSG